MQAYTVEQVAKMLHIGRDKVYYLLRTGQLRSIKIGKLPPHHRTASRRVHRVTRRRSLGTSRDFLSYSEERSQVK